jgi:hypothetical protein
MAVFSKITILEDFKEVCGILFKEDDKTPYREYKLDQQFLPHGTENMEGTWEIAVSFTPRKKRK